MTLAHLESWWASTPTAELIWITIGFMAQFMFSMSFIVQWIATEKARASIIPETFWYFSFVGGLTLLACAMYRTDPVFIVGQAPGLEIYARRLGKRAPSPANVA